MAACKFVIESEVFSEEETERLQEALVSLAESDAPLFFELAIVSEEEIQRLNRTERNVDKV
ncbi:MAG: hypothetical protein K2N74_03000, partial [Clostridiales bacterium]|nr:hypothetical protein [Clostridiales bacterium]